MSTSFSFSQQPMPLQVLTIMSDGTVIIHPDANIDQLRNALQQLAELHYNDVIWPRIMAEKMKKET